MLFLLNLFLFPIIFFPINCSLFNLNMLKYSERDKIIDNIVLDSLKIFSKKLYYIEELPGLTQKCKKLLNQSYFIYNSNISEADDLLGYYYMKFILDSSTNINDLSSYANCMHSDHGYHFYNLTDDYKPKKSLYITIFIDHRKEQLQFFRNNSTITSFLLGICFIEGCNEGDLKIISENVMDLLDIMDRNQTFEIFTLNSQPYVIEYWNIFPKFIPFYIIFLHIFIVLFGKILLFIFEKMKKLCCPGKNKHKININFSQAEELNKKILNDKAAKKRNQKLKNYIKALFDVKDNFNFESNNSKYNVNSFYYINAIKGISLITMIFGFTFLDLYNAPITKKSLDTFYEISSHYFFSIFYFGIKYAPKIILSTSGFSLFYKFMNYLDDKVEIEKEMKHYLIKSKYDDKNIENYLKNKDNNKIDDNNKDNDNDNDDDDKNGDNTENKKVKNDDLKKEDEEDNPLNKSRLEKKSNKKIIPFKYYFLFLLKQIHKYILYLLLISFTLFSLYDVLIILTERGPQWTLFNKKIINTSLKISNLIPAIFCYQGTFLNQFDSDSLFAYLFLVYQEIIFFVVNTLKIFIGFKYNLRFDRFILVEISLFFFARIFYYYLTHDLYNRDYFDLNNFGYFYNSPFYNYLYYDFGIYFGALNYVIQKGYKYSDCEREQKMYLLGFTKFLKILKRKSKSILFYFLGIIFSVFIIIFSLIQFLLFEYVKYIENVSADDIHQYSNILNVYNNDIFISIVMMFDADFVVVLINLMALFFYLEGNNLINDFLNINFFAILNKIYFSFIISLNPIIFYFLYMTESRISFNIQNCYLYSFACAIYVFFGSILIYGIFELPYKKFIKLFLNNSQVQLEEKRMELIENEVDDLKKDEDKENEDSKSDSSFENE